MVLRSDRPAWLLFLLALIALLLGDGHPVLADAPVPGRLELVPAARLRTAPGLDPARPGLAHQPEAEQASANLTVRVGDRVLRRLGARSGEPVVGRVVSFSGQAFVPVAHAPAPSPGLSDAHATAVANPPIPEERNPVRIPPPQPFPRLLVVVTNDWILSKSSMLQRYLAWRQAGGWQVVLGTEAQWDQPVEEDGDDRQARIRGWLRRVHQEHGPGYLLLVGDPDPRDGGIPMRRTEPLIRLLTFTTQDLRESLSEVPTDNYYGDLESSWDCNGNGVFAEYPDDAAPLDDAPTDTPAPCADWGPELIVGRIPVYHGSTTALDLVLTRTLAWEQTENKSHRRRVLLAGAFGGFRGQPTVAGLGTYGEDDDLGSFLDRIGLDLMRGYFVGSYRLFEREGLVISRYPHNAGLSRAALLDTWRQGYGVVAWGGHGSATGTYRLIWARDPDGNGLADGWNEVAGEPMIETRDTLALREAPASIVHSMSCLNGYPETGSNLGAAVLFQTAVATASSSRSTVGVSGDDWRPSPELGCATTGSYYYNLLLQEQGVSAGEALAYTRYALPANGWGEYYGGSSVDNGYGWLVKLEYNLYGDPTVGLERCDEALGCDDGLPCNGQESCEKGFCIRRQIPDCASLDKPCQLGVCDNRTGSCTQQPRHDGLPCDDGLWCTEVDRCVAGTCTGQPRACAVPDGMLPVCDEEARCCTWTAPPTDPTSTEADLGRADPADATTGGEEPDSGMPAPQPANPEEESGCRIVRATPPQALLRGLLHLLLGR